MNKPITVIHHSADYDGIFSREIARKFLPPHTKFIGWDFPDKPLDDKILSEPGLIYIIDLPVDRPFGLEFKDGWICKDGEQKQPVDRWDDSGLIWIDHHKSSIESHPTGIPGYRIDGVAACRLAWQWFQLHAQWDPREQHPPFGLPDKQAYIDRQVDEPIAVRLAGEYDIWDKRDPRAETFQYGLDTEIDSHPHLFDWVLKPDAGVYVQQIIAQGQCARTCIAKRDADMMKRSFKFRLAGLTFLALNIAKCNSLTFAALDKPETGHDALCGFYWNGKCWTVSLYHAKHNTGVDLSEIAKQWGGGGHRGACGFTVAEPSFINGLTPCI